MRHLDDDENLLLLMVCGTTANWFRYESGFKIELLGAYKTLPIEDLLITFDAHEASVLIKVMQ